MALNICLDCTLYFLTHEHDIGTVQDLIVQSNLIQTLLKNEKLYHFLEDAWVEGVMLWLIAPLSVYQMFPWTWVIMVS